MTTIQLGVGPTLGPCRVVIGDVLRTVRQCDGVRNDTKERFVTAIFRDFAGSDDGTVRSSALGLAIFFALHRDEDAAGVLKLIEAIHDPRNVRFLPTWPRPRNASGGVGEWRSKGVKQLPPTPPLPSSHTPLLSSPGLAIGTVLFVAAFLFAAALCGWFLWS